MGRSILLFWCYLTLTLGDLARDISRVEQYIAHNRNQVKRKFRPNYHITVPIGWLNDPAGFTYFNGQYHLFYQFYPYNSAWGPMHWGHVVSENLVDWMYYPVALIPTEYYESSGCLSGCAITHSGYLILFYTGNSHSDNSTKQTQNIAISSDGVIFQKYLNNPVIKDLPDNIWKFRHPKVWQHNCTWYMIVGSSTPDHRGRIILYTSDDLYSWKLSGTIVESQGDMGYMWENPDIVELEGHHVLLFSAHGIQSEFYQFRNLYQTGYIVGTFNYTTKSLEDMEVSTATFNELDHGHDFYAAQSFKSPDGRVLMVAWLGMWESEFTESEDGWAGMMTLIRELKLSREAKLLMTPVRETIELRAEVMEDATYIPGEEFNAETKFFELIVDAKIINTEVILIFSLGEDSRYIIAYSVDKKLMSVDRGGIDGVRRAYWHPSSNGLHWRIYVDASSIEVYCGAGEVVFSSRIYPSKKINIMIAGNTPVHILQYRLRKSVGYNNIISRKLWQSYL